MVRPTRCCVMPGLVPGIHVLLIGSSDKEDVDGRVKPGHDGALIPELLTQNALIQIMAGIE